jgi:hypothetical protein
MLHRRMTAQRMVTGEGILEEGRLECGEVEAPGESPGLVLGQLDQTLAQN